MATMKEIAELAGVSRGTVDRVLNHRGSVNEETKKKILDIARLLDYKPNKAGIALAAQKKKSKIGVILFGSDNPFFDQISEGIHGRAQELSIYGCHIIEKRVPFSIEEQLAAMEELEAEEICGMILSPYNHTQIQKKIDLLYEKGIPTVTINTDIPNSKRIAYVGSDFHKCGRTAGELVSLFTQSAPKIGIVTGSRNILCHEERIAGFSEYLKEHLPEAAVLDTKENQDDDYLSFDVVTKLLTMHPDLDVLYFTAAGVYGGCRAILNTPHSSSLKVITFDAVPSTIELLKKGIISATITQEPTLQGATSVSILMEFFLSDKTPEKEFYHMQLSVKVQESL